MLCYVCLSVSLSPSVSYSTNLLNVNMLLIWIALNAVCPLQRHFALLHLPMPSDSTLSATIYNLLEVTPPLILHRDIVWDRVRGFGFREGLHELVGG